MAQASFGPSDFIPRKSRTGRSVRRILNSRPDIHAIREAQERGELHQEEGEKGVEAIAKWRDHIKRAQAMRVMMRRAQDRKKLIESREPTSAREAALLQNLWQETHRDALRFQAAFGHHYNEAQAVRDEYNKDKASVPALYTDKLGVWLFKDERDDNGRLVPLDPEADADEIARRKAERDQKIGQPIIGPDGKPVMITAMDVLHVQHVESERDFHRFRSLWQRLGMVESVIADYRSVVEEYFGQRGLSRRDMEVSALAEGTLANTTGDVQGLADAHLPPPNEEGAMDSLDDALADLDRYMDPDEAEAFGRDMQAVFYEEGAMPPNVAAFFERVGQHKAKDDPMPEDPKEQKRWLARQRLNRREEEARSLSRMPLTTLTEMREALSADAHELWGRREVRARWNEHVYRKLILDAKAGEAVLEIPQVIRIANTLRRWEREDGDSLVGGALVGPPGTGKSTGIEYYLEKMGRPRAIRMDMSEELTRYALFGSPEVQFESDIDRYKQLAERVASLTEEDVLNMVKEHTEKLEAALGDMSQEERAVIALATLRGKVDEIIAAGPGVADTETHAHVQALKDALANLAQREYQSELATQLADITHKNGWRDGIIIHALRQQRPLIIDEFNAAKSWTLINKLLSGTKPGESYYFTDNKEEIPIPEWWRIYFTANIGGKYGRRKVQEDMASRFGKKVIEVDYADSSDEFMVMVALICNAYTEILRDTDDVYKLGVFVNEVVPKLRAEMNKAKTPSNPISFRTYHEIGRALVTPGPAGSPRPSTSVDRAIFESVVNPFALWVDRDLVKRLISLMMEADLLIDDEGLWDDIMRWHDISKEELQRRKDEVDHAERRKAADKLIRGAQASFGARMMGAGVGLS